MGKMAKKQCAKVTYGCTSTRSQQLQEAKERDLKNLEMRQAWRRQQAIEIKRIKNVKVGFIGMTLEATDTLVAAAGIQGWDFLDEAETANALVPELQAQGVEAIVVLLHEGGSQTPPPGDVDACVGISGPIVAINDALDPAIDVMITGHTHLITRAACRGSIGAMPICRADGRGRRDMPLLRIDSAVACRPPSHDSCHTGTFGGPYVTAIGYNNHHANTIHRIGVTRDLGYM